MNRACGEESNHKEPYRQEHTIQFYSYSAKTIQLSQGALQSQVPEPPSEQAL